MLSEYRFHMPIAGRLDERGRFVRLTLRERLQKALWGALFPSKALYRVVGIDDIAGRVTMERI